MWLAKLADVVAAAAYIRSFLMPLPPSVVKAVTPTLYCCGFSTPGRDLDGRTVTEALSQITANTASLPGVSARMRQRGLVFPSEVFTWQVCRSCI